MSQVNSAANFTGVFSSTTFDEWFTYEDGDQHTVEVPSTGEQSPELPAGEEGGDVPNAKAAKKATKDAAKAIKDAQEAADKAAKAEAKAEAKKLKEAQTIIDKAAKAEAKKAKQAQAAADKAVKAAAVEKKKADDIAAHNASFKDAESTLVKGDKIAAQVDAYEIEVQTSVQKTLAALYALLAVIYGFVLEVLADPNSEMILGHMRFKLSNDYGIKTQANSPAINIIVRYVTRTNRKNASVYSRVLGVAMSKNKAANELEKFIRDNKGLSNIHPDPTGAKVKVINDNKKVERIYQAAARYTMSKLFNKAHTGSIMGEIPFTDRMSSRRADTKGGSYFCPLIGCYGNGKLKIIDFMPGFTPEREDQMLRSYADQEVKELCMHMPDDLAMKTYYGQIKHLFATYNAYAIQQDWKMRFTPWGETLNGDGDQVSYFHEKWTDLEAAYAQWKLTNQQVSTPNVLPPTQPLLALPAPAATQSGAV